MVVDDQVSDDAPIPFAVAGEIRAGVRPKVASMCAMIRGIVERVCRINGEADQALAEGLSPDERAALREAYAQLRSAVRARR